MSISLTYTKMIQALFYTIISVVIVSLISLIGISPFLIKKLRSEEVLHFLVSFAAGALLGDALLHILPHVVEDYGFSLSVSLAIMVGIIIFFVLEKFLSWHHCHMHGTKQECDVKPYAYMNIMSDGLHNFIDGLIIGASYLISIPIGIATTIAVAFHEIPQEIGDFAILLKAGFSRTKALLFNFASATMAILGGILSFFIGTKIGGFLSFVLPLTAGGFIYIALADLIPELHKEPSTTKSFLHLVGMVLGIAAMVGILLLE